ncbi:hypothetical protein NS365_05460 [Aureimonas ureilytica]|uniref:Uncharacterized protein n=1 Tax=Aureimonas ureilytica TaxID=401562 RepID=A0A175RVK7_9HYPH|nr:hypothetical protein [Aureimonas ureilytica]KTR06882.1 hypothetical protein NS365_05460 [Aureimonas ureilytica]
MPPGDQIMWKAIRAALGAITNALSMTTSMFANGLWWMDRTVTNTWNWIARSTSGTNYRPAPVHDAERHVDAIVERAPEPVTPADDMADRGRQVRSAATRILCGDRTAGADLPSDVRLWLLALDKPDLRIVLAASDTMIGRHASGDVCIKGTGGRPVPTPDVERDLLTIKRREEALTRDISAQERQHLEDLLAVRSTRAMEALDEPDVDEPQAVPAPRLVA